MMLDQKQDQRNNKSKAQSLFEFALILPILLVLIISAIELGRLFYTKIVITNAAREGAYYLTTHASDVGAASNTQLAAETEAANSGISEITVVITPETGWQTGDKIVVKVDTTVDNLLVIGFLGNILSLTITNSSFYLSSSVQMMVQP